MAKFKAAGSRKKSMASNLRAIPCMILIVGVLVVVLLLFYEILKSGT
ncbi:MAG TPA: hypothetical protein VGR73_22375 [Bryobacteraceae bacterium]|nr:hypothetical protein [Bryobacteraceae bacterium]